MRIVSFEEAESDLDRIFLSAVEDDEETVIVRPNRESMVLVSLARLQALREAASAMP